MIIFLLTLIVGFLLIGSINGAFSEPATQEKDKYGDTAVNSKKVVKLGIALVAALVIAAINPLEVERIDVGNVGLKVNNTGDERGVSKTVYVTGWVPYLSWFSRIKEFPTTQQHIDYEENVIITRGGFQATIKPSFNWSVNSANAADMYQNLRKDVDDIRDTWLKNAIIGAVNDVANLYTVDSIFNHRAEFESEIIRECNKRVSKWFTVSQLRTNIVPPPAITEAINAKTKAVQEAQGAVQRTIVAQAEAQEKIARAKGDSAQAVIAASGRAEAVKKEQQFLTPLYIEYLKVQKWKGEVPSTILGSNASTLINLK